MYNRRRDHYSDEYSAYKMWHIKSDIFHTLVISAFGN